MAERVAVYGQGGHSKVIQMMLNDSVDQQIGLIADDDQAKVNEQATVKIVLADKLPDYQKEFDSLIIAIGNNEIRRKIAGKYQSMQFATVIATTAVVAKDAILREGTVVMAETVINPDVQIGKHCIINTSAVVEHDCRIGDYSHVSPAAVLTGNVQVGNNVHIGANATILPGIRIGDYAVIGAGAVVIKDVAAGSVLVGNPARKIK
ncbi:acetyltransferase [Carnobacterium mobile]|uniref:acetyltransferase n=1 Tax=Carnobacterium mobile TaxID=2750 RepID=UPI00054FEA41|nr:acetyltransferase [Carnobacterium mobile]